MKRADGESLVVGCMTDKGAVRQTNQDAQVLVDPPDPEARARLGVLCVVSDGMGGAAGGETASAIVTEVVPRAYYSYAGDEPKEALRAAIEAANFEVFSLASQRPELRGMGATCVALALRDGVAHLVHVGDSRAYLLRNNSLLQLTEDHSKVAQLLRDGYISPEEAVDHPHKNVLLRVVGGKASVDVDLSVPPVECLVGDRFVLCSDGLYNMVSEHEVLSTVLSNSPQQAAETLVARANQNGGEDNITVQVVQIGQGSLVHAGSEEEPIGPRLPAPKTNARWPSWLSRTIGLVAVVLALLAGVWIGMHLDAGEERTGIASQEAGVSSMRYAFPEPKGPDLVGRGASNASQSGRPPMASLTPVPTSAKDAGEEGIASKPVLAIPKGSRSWVSGSGPIPPMPASSAGRIAPAVPMDTAAPKHQPSALNTRTHQSPAFRFSLVARELADVLSRIRRSLSEFRKQSEAAGFPDSDQDGSGCVGRGGTCVPSAQRGCCKSWDAALCGNSSAFGCCLPSLPLGLN